MLSKKKDVYFREFVYAKTSKLASTNFKCIFMKLKFLWRDLYCPVASLPIILPISS